MTISVADLIAAIPPDDDEEVREPLPALAHDPELQRVFAAISRRPVPVGALRRLWSLGGLQAQLAVAYGAYWVKGWFQNADARQRSLLETHVRAAVRLLSTMTYLRGTIMKIGQFLANVPDVVPDQIAEMLSRLYYQAPPMHYALLREHVHSELGADPEELFGEFDPTAFAAASLGQVHRARLKTGEEVAVKVQYPGIAQTICSDFRTLHALVLPLRLSKNWDNFKDQTADIRAVLERETDYEQEAENQRRARSLFTESDGIVVPRVFDRYCTKRVLTTEFIEGVHPPQWMKTNPPQELRDHFGALSYRAIWRMFFSGRSNYVDPHPGNFLILDDGRLAMIDFGCMRPYNDDEWDFCRQYRWTLLGREGYPVERLVRRGCMFKPDEAVDADQMRVIMEYNLWCWEPYLHDRVFDFGNGGFLRRGLDLLSEASKKRYTRGMPMVPLVSRQYFQTYSLMYLLRARFNVKRIGDEEARATGWDEMESS
ncbi:MAG: AarF/ABC1/UbiB kinase family protein [Planctomycetia bacterium]|nr:AarF/ABC1/UbiB kinase family protein [Planctomycetia bacterium]